MKINSFKIIEKIVKPYKIYNLYYFRSVRGFSLDSRSIKKQEAFIALPGKHKDGHDYIKAAVKKGASLIIASRYTELNEKIPQFIVEDGYESLQRIVSFLRKKNKKAKIIAVTGSLGKTTTKEIIDFLLKPYFTVLKNKKTENNLLGVAKTIFSYSNQDVIIFELGTNKKGELAELTKLVKPDIGVITCIKPVHLDGLGSLRQVKEEKLSLLRYDPKIQAVLNSKDPLLFRAKIKNKTYWFGKNKKDDLYYRRVKRGSGKVYFKILNKYDLTLPIQFEYFIDNCLAALLSAHLLAIDFDDLILRLNYFKSYPAMRMEQKKIGNYLILNDAYNANPESFKKALLVLKHFNLPKVIVAADMFELGSRSSYYHRRLAFQIFKTNFDYCLTFGKYTQITNKQLKDLGCKNVLHFSCQQAIADFLKEKLNSKKYLIFLKGSRGMELEKVLKFL